MGAIFFIFLIGGGGMALANMFRMNTQSSWATVAEKLGLHLEPGSLFRKPRIYGELRGISVRVETVTRGSGDNSSTSTVYTTSHSADGPPVRFLRQGTFSFLRGLVGRVDVAVGDPRFDDSVVVDTEHPAAITEFLTAARRAAIYSVFSTWRSAEIDDHQISVRTNGTERDASVMVGTINRLVDTSRLLESSPAVEHALEAREAGDLAAATAELHEINAADVPNVVTQVIEAESLVTLGRPEEAVIVLDAVAESLPADAEAAGWRAAATSTLPPPPAAPAASATALDEQSLIDDLLGPGRVGHEIEMTFEQMYRGQTVEWTGEVESTRDFRSDADFGSEAGTKVVALIGSIGQSNLFSNRVKAVIELPAELDLKRGATISFRGTLLRVDRFTRSIYVADAQLTSG